MKLLTCHRHCFCLDCAKQSGLATVHAIKRKCPTCSTALIHERDVVEMNLKPTEDYISSILCGLDPQTILECAGYALMFWNYQQSQEM